MRRFACAVLLAAAFPAAALAGPADDEYIAARNKAVATLAAADKAGKSDEELIKLDDDARKDLEKRMTALLGPIQVKGFEGSYFSPDTLIPGGMGSDSPDGIVLSTEDSSSFLFVAPEPVFLDWLKTRSTEEYAPPAFKEGIGPASGTDDFYTLTIGNDAAFSLYVSLPVKAADGETVSAGLGMFSQDFAANQLPGTIVLTRVADGRVMVATADVDFDIPDLKDCDKVWDGFSAKAEALSKEVEKSKNEDDPRWEQVGDLQAEGSEAFRACFAKAAKDQPFFAKAVAQAETLLGTVRGK